MVDPSLAIAPRTPLRALIVEDNAFDAELILYELRRSGFDVTWKRVEDEEEYRAALDDVWDVIIADYVLPLFTAPRALELLHQRGVDTAFIVVTGQAGEERAVELIRLGAADYLMKDRLLRLGSSVYRELDLRDARRARADADRRLRDSERRHRQIAMHITDYACSTRLHADGRMELEWFTPATERFLGSAVDECMLTGGILALAHPDDAIAAQAQRERALHRVSSVEEFRVRRIDGEERWVRNHVLVDHEDDRADSVRVLIAGQDITAQRREADALARRTAELTLRNEELDAFAHTVAHDLRNPLNLIIGYAELFCDEEDVPYTDLQPHLRTIARTGRLMNNIIEELMLLSGVRNAHPEMQPLDLGMAARGALLRVQHLAEEAGARISLADRWPYAVGHPAWVEEALVNYMSNAIKYGGQPPQVDVLAEPLDDGRVRCMVRDNGNGISAENHGKLFIPFSRLDGVRARGTGLGLSIVRRLIERMNGTVAVESEEGEGSVFSFILPAAPSLEVVDIRA